MSDIKSDVKETVKAFIQTLVSILVREATKTMIKNLTERQKKRFEDKIKDMSDDQLGQYLDENPYFKDSLENALKSLGSTHSSKETVSLMDKLQSVYEGTSIKKQISSFIWPAPKIILVTVVGIALLSSFAVQAFSENRDNNTSLPGNNSTLLFDNNTTSTQSPVANFTTNVTNGSSPLTVQFSDLSENAKERSWDFGDGNNSKELNPVHTYFAKGNYTVNLTAINGTKTNSIIATITVLEMPVQSISEGSMSGPSKPAEPTDSGDGTLPVANFSTNITSGYAPLTVQFNDSSQNATSWIWAFGDGQISSAQNPINTYYSAGTYTVSLTVSNANGSNISTKSNLVTVDKTTQTLNWNNPADIIYETALSRTQLNAVSSVPGDFAYTPSAGTVLSAGTHTLHVDFTPVDTANYTTASKDVQINILQATPYIEWSSPEDITYGTALSTSQLNAVASRSGSFNYTSDGIPIDVGTVLDEGIHILHVDFTPGDAVNYSAISKEVTISVVPSGMIPTIIWSPEIDYVTYGEALGYFQLYAFAIDPITEEIVPGQFVYTPPEGILLNADTQVNISFTPTDIAKYNTASKNVMIYFQKATPIIDWSNPADIVYGTALNDTQLNATASYNGSTVPGTFVYSPGNGTILNAGIQKLHTEFTPNDTENYTNATVDVTINVLNANYAYITNYWKNNVSVIDPTNKVIATVPVGSHPIGVAVNPAGTRVYVTNDGNKNVSIIDTTTNVVIATVPVGLTPKGIAVTQDSTKVYVTNLNENTVSVIDTTSNNVIATVSVESEPFGVAVTPDGTKVYVANTGSNNVSVIDTTSNTVTATVSVEANPRGVAITPDGTKVYVTNAGSSNVSVIDISTNTVTTTVPVESNPWGVAVNPMGTSVYVTNSESDDISVIDTATNTVTSTVRVGRGPMGVSVTPDGTKVYVVNWKSEDVTVFDTVANNITATVPVADAGPWTLGQFTGSIS